MIDFTVLGGYLGAGKTTLLNHILKHNDGRRIALLINDFGAINIDAQLIESRDEHQINLANGCVCCSLSDGFHEALDTLVSLQPPPEHVIVEASGVADVHNLAQYGYGNEFRLSGTIVVADAETVRQKANDKYVAQTVRRQLKSADLIVLNKIDLCSSEWLDEVHTWLSAETGNVPVIRAVRGAVPVSVLLDLNPGFTPGLAPDQLPENHEHHHHEEYTSWSYQEEAVIDRAQLESFMQNLPAGVIRAKGLFPQSDGSVLELQVVGRRRELNSLHNDSRRHAEMVAIGLSGQLQTTALDALVEEFLTVST